MTLPGRIIRIALALAVLAPVTACPSPEGNIERIAGTARSWGATARSTSEALAGGTVPRVYARQVLRAALDSKRQLSREPEWPSLPANTRDQLEDAIRELASAVDARDDSLPRP